MSVQHRTGVDYRHSTAAKNRCDVRENDGRVTVDITHREASGCARCGCVRFVTRNVMDDQLRMSSATCCALCGAVDQLLIVPEVPSSSRSSASRPSSMSCPTNRSTSGRPSRSRSSREDASLPQVGLRRDCAQARPRRRLPTPRRRARHDTRAADPLRPPATRLHCRSGRCGPGRPARPVRSPGGRLLAADRCAGGLVRASGAALRCRQSRAPAVSRP